MTDAIKFVEFISPKLLDVEIHHILVKIYCGIEDTVQIIDDI